MRAMLIGFFCALLMASAPALAAERVSLGFGRLLTNDMLGDGKDRWRTGSYVLSIVRGRKAWDGKRPENFGDIIEYRIRGEVFAPASITAPVAGDRRFAGAWSLGAHTHFARGNFQISTGIDVVMTGKQTLLGEMQRGFHDLLGTGEPSAAMLGNQIGNGFHPTVSFEINRRVLLSDTVFLRPFIEARIGDEDLIRIGGDVLFGRVAQNDLLLRDVSTGQLYRGTRSDDVGLSFLLGGDIAKVYDSIYLPASSGYTLTDTRSRLRGGLEWRDGNRSVFYGITWLSEEFTAQPEGQILGSVSLHWKF